MSKGTKIAIVGGGSVAWTPQIVRDMLLTPSLADAHYVLLDIDRRASDLTKAFMDKLAGELGCKAKFTSTSRPRDIAGASYVVIAVSTGGLRAMSHDLAIPERFGIYHTVGDTSGPGGWARLMRNFDAFVALAEGINRYAPGAMVLNYTNPMTTLTDLLARLCKGPVIGLCHGLFENIEFLKAFYGPSDESGLSLKYAGLNHFFWITQATAGKVNAIADLSRRLATRGFTELIRKAEAKPGSKSYRELATELMRLTGFMPYLGDRHTSEFFPCYITSRENIAKYRLVRTTIRQREESRARHAARIRAMIRGPIDPRYKQRTRETAADIIDAHLRGRPFIDVGNLPNQGQISNLPRGLVVETAVRVDQNGFSPIVFGDLPGIVKGFIAPYAAAYPMAVDACFRKDKRLAVQSLRLDPVCSHLNGEQVTQLAERLLGAHRKFITAF